MRFVAAAYIATGMLIGSYIASVIWRARVARREEAQLAEREGRG